MSFVPEIVRSGVTCVHINVRSRSFVLFVGLTKTIPAVTVTRFQYDFIRARALGESDKVIIVIMLIMGMMDRFSET